MGKLFDVSLVFSSIPELLTKLPITLELAVVSMLIGLGLGLVMAIIKMKKIRVLTQITNLLISLLRGTPVIVQLYVAFFGIPMMFKAINQQFGTNLAVANISVFKIELLLVGIGADVITQLFYFFLSDFRCQRKADARHALRYCRRTDWQGVKSMPLQCFRL